MGDEGREGWGTIRNNPRRPAIQLASRLTWVNGSTSPRSTSVGAGDLRQPANSASRNSLCEHMLESLAINPNQIGWKDRQSLKSWTKCDSVGPSRDSRGDGYTYANPNTSARGVRLGPAPLERSMINAVAQRTGHQTTRRPARSAPAIQGGGPGILDNGRRAHSITGLGGPKQVLESLVRHREGTNQPIRPRSASVRLSSRTSPPNKDDIAGRRGNNAYECLIQNPPGLTPYQRFAKGVRNTTVRNNDAAG